jgi:transposase
MLCAQTFLSPQLATHKQYEALRAYYVDGLSAAQAAERFGYTLSAFYSLLHQVRHRCGDDANALGAYFFHPPRVGRRPKDSDGSLVRRIVQLRQRHLSVPQIKASLDSLGESVSERYIAKILQQEGFERLGRRTTQQRQTSLSGTLGLDAPKSQLLSFESESFAVSNSIGALCLLPYLQHYGITALLEQSSYPQTQPLPRVNALLSFVGLKLTHVRRYSHDDLWCMDRGLGLFAGLNVLPKSAWLSSYSWGVNRQMNLQFLKGLNRIWDRHHLLSDTANLDFTTLPAWGDGAHLEKNWSGTRNRMLTSILTALAQDPESGIITYGDTTVRHDNKNQVVLEFLDFYSTSASTDLKYLVFDSKFTTYEHLRQLDEKGIKFITIRRRGSQILKDLDALSSSQWITVKVRTSKSKYRSLKVYEQQLNPRDYGKQLRQISISGAGKEKPALIISNDFDLTIEQVVRKYAQRWLVEKEISEQIEFFHLNRLSSSMVIKVDFDLVMTLLTHNLLRLLATDLVGYDHAHALSIYNHFLQNSGRVEISASGITIFMKKKRALPTLMAAMEKFQGLPLQTHQGKVIRFCTDNTS